MQNFYLLFINENPVGGHNLFSISIPENSVDPRMGLNETFENDCLSLSGKLLTHESFKTSLIVIISYI